MRAELSVCSKSCLQNVRKRGCRPACRMYSLSVQLPPVIKEAAIVIAFRWEILTVPHSVAAQLFQVFIPSFLLIQFNDSIPDAAGKVIELSVQSRLANVCRKASYKCWKQNSKKPTLDHAGILNRKEG